jgi:hypothetical protein
MNIQINNFTQLPPPPMVISCFHFLKSIVSKSSEKTSFSPNSLYSNSCSLQSPVPVPVPVPSFFLVKFICLMIHNSNKKLLKLPHFYTWFRCCFFCSLYSGSFCGCWTCLVFKIESFKTTLYYLT